MRWPQVCRLVIFGGFLLLFAALAMAQQEEMDLTGFSETITGLVEKPQVQPTYIRQAPTFDVITGDQRRSFLDLLLEPIPQGKVGEGNNSKTVGDLLKPQKQKLKVNQ